MSGESRRFDKNRLQQLFSSWLPSSRQAMLGLDISSTAIKMVELSRHGRTPQLERYAVEPLAKDLITDGNINNMDEVADAIRRTWHRLGSPAKRAAIALPTSMAIYKKILVPAGALGDDLELQVENEANQYIPFPLEEVNLDYQVLGPSSNSADDLDVMICASRKEKVEERVAVAEMAGLKVDIVDIDAFAMMTAFEQIQQQLPDQGMNQTFAHPGYPATLRLYLRGGRSRQTQYDIAGRLRSRIALSVCGLAGTGNPACAAIFLHHGERVAVSARGLHPAGRRVQHAVWPG